MKNYQIITLIAITLIILSSCKKCDYVQNNCTDCPPGFLQNIVNDNCEKISSESAVFNGSLFTIAKANTNPNYSINGAKLYDTIATNTYPITSNPSGLEDASGTPLTSSPPLLGFWTNRLNVAGVWSTFNLVDQWIGFSTCVTVDVDTKVCIGIGADNRCRFDINPPNPPRFVELDNSNIYNFTTWHVFEYLLLKGDNIIIMEGLDDASPAAFAAEIYKGSFADLASWTTVAQLDSALIFSTRDQIGLTFQTGVTNGYSCPNGLAVDFCSGDSIPVCTSIERVNYLPCQSIVIQ